MIARGGSSGSCLRRGSALGFMVLLAAVLLGEGAEGAEKRPQREDSIERGRALFFRVWKPEDTRAHGGDGLGPMFNERSCVACHNLGGAGGAGSTEKNVDVLTILATRPTNIVRSNQDAADSVKPSKFDVNAMAMIHAGFATSRSIVLHRFGTAPNYENWRRNLLAEDPFGVVPKDDSLPLSEPAELPGSVVRGDFTLLRTQRNSTSLFGAGLIDTIPDEAIDVPPRKPETKGRVNRLKNGRIGKFGWKSQMATLEEFVTTACSVELGLEVPGHHQGSDPLGCARSASGLDMSQEECNDLVAFVRGLPAPMVRASSNAVGRKLFDTIGCADCHVPKLGEVEGIFSDLLLHDLGEGLQDTGGYGTFVAPPAPGEEIPEEPLGPTLVDAQQVQGPPKPPQEAGRLEWRTPPLWGVRDSAPYLHDGRAKTLAHAIELHGGEARSAAHRFRSLSSTQQRQVIQFLQSLVAPRQSGNRLVAARRG